MANLKLTPQQFIKNSFNPQVGVLCTSGAEQLCGKNNLSFIEMLQPFCRLNTELHYKDPNGLIVTIRNLKISLNDVHAKPPQTVLARKLLNESVSEETSCQMKTVTIGEYNVEVPGTVAWFESWRETFFEVQYPADHEFTKHFLGCIIVLSTSDPNPLQEVVNLKQSLQQLQNPSLNKLPKWFNSNILTYFVLLHENLGNNVNIKANDIYEKVKTAVSPAHCFLLKINSQTPDGSGEQLADPWSQFISSKKVTSCSLGEETKYENVAESCALPHLEIGQEVEETTPGGTVLLHPLSPENEANTLFERQVLGPQKITTKSRNVLHGAYLSTQDVEEIKHLVNDFAVRGLMPYVERQIHQLSDFVANKKGVSKSLLSATKRWFTPNKPTSNSATVNTLTYPPDAPELQVRRLGDLYFMFGQYSLAFHEYHAAKRDFSADQAWLYFAGALEMAALSAFMAGESSRKSFEYMEESISTYLIVCKMPQFATKATLLGAECLKGQHMYGEAAHQFIRMANEDSDLRSALLLEQAAYCFLQCSRPCMVRKYAFHMVMAGHRFNKAAQRKHSLRCNQQAYQIYQRKGWNVAEHHILSSIGRLAYSLDELEVALKSYAKLLTEESKQTPQQQELYLKEYLTINKELSKRQNNLLTPILPMPIVINESIRVLVGPAPPLRTPGKVPAMGVLLGTTETEKDRRKWCKLEELMVQEAQGAVPMIFKPLVTLFSGADVSSVNPIAVIGEPIQVAVELYNPLQIVLNLKDIFLLWQVKNEDNNKFAVNEIMGHNLDSVMRTTYLKSLVLEPNSKREVVLSITPLSISDVLVTGICYSVLGTNSTEGDICLRGKQVFNIKGPKTSKRKDDVLDRKLQLKVVPSTACLQVTFTEMSSAELLRNELQKLTVELRNVGSVPLYKIYVASSTPHLISSEHFRKRADVPQDLSNLTETSNREREARKNHVFSLPLPNDTLDSGQYYTIDIWLKAPDEIGPSSIDLLIYYENVNASGPPKYRLVRHVWHLSIQDSLKVDANAFQSHKSRDAEQLALVVHVTNLNKAHHAVLTEITLLSASLLSDNWQLCSEPRENRDPVQLRPQASHYLFLKLRRSVSASVSHTEMRFAAVESGIGEEVGKVSLDFARRHDRSKLNIFSAPQDLESWQARKKRDALLIFQWKANVTDSAGRHRVVYGQNQVSMQVPTQGLSSITNIPITLDQQSVDKDPRSTTTMETLPMIQTSLAQQPDRQITCNLLHSFKVMHNFQERQMCVVPVKVVLHSISAVPLIIMLQAVGTNGTSLPRGSLPCSEQFRWIKVGNSTRRIEPLASVEISTFVATLNPGTYDLGSRLEIWAQHVDGPQSAVRQINRIKSFLIITDR